MLIKKDPLERIGFDLETDSDDFKVYRKKDITIVFEKKEFGLVVSCQEDGRYTFFYAKELKAACKVLEEMKQRGMN